MYNNIQNTSYIIYSNNRKTYENHVILLMVNHIIGIGTRNPHGDIKGPVIRLNSGRL
jgi:hypothetical protein